MTRVGITVDCRPARSHASPAKTLAPSLSCVRRAQPLFGGLGGAYRIALPAGLMIGSVSFLEGDL